MSEIIDEELMGRFHSRYSKADGNECWEWRGSSLPTGYGRIKHKGKYMLAHRISYEIHHGPLVPGLFVDHKCRRPSCVNPGHLHQVTPALNSQNRSGAAKNSFAGMRGVTWSSDKKRWRARVTIGGRVIHGGYFRRIEDAEAAAIHLRRVHHPNSLMDRIA